MLRAERQWNRGHEMQDSRKDKRVHTRNDTDSGDAKERRETKQSAAARPGRALQDQHGAQAMLNTTARDRKVAKTQGG